MFRNACVMLACLLLVVGCRWDLSRGLSAGELRAQVVRFTDTGTEPSSGAVVEVTGTRQRLSVDAQGRFIARGLPPGMYDIRIEESLDEDPAPELGLVIRGVRLEADGTGAAIGRDLGTVGIGALGSIEGAIVGAPAGLVDAWAVVEGFTAAPVGTSGEFRLSSLPPGTYGVGVAGRDPSGQLVWASYEVEVRAREAARLEIDLSLREPVRTGSVSGLARYDDGTSPLGIEVSLELLGSRRSEEVGTANEAGLYNSTAPVPAGAYTLVGRGIDGTSVRAGPLLVRGETEAPLLVLPAVAPSDRDLDGIDDASDVCPATFDPLQADADGDGEGDFCDADVDGDGVPNGEDATLVLLSGSGQSGEVGLPLELPVTVRVFDAWGEPARSARVRFLADAGTFDPVTVDVGTDALASSSWVLPEAAGPVVGTVSIEGSRAAPLTVEALAMPGGLQAIELDGLPARMKVLQPGELVATLRDRFGNVAERFEGVLAVTTTDALASVPATVAVAVEQAGVVRIPLNFGSIGAHDVAVTDAGAGGATGATIAVEVVPEATCGDGDIDDWVGETCDDGDALTNTCAYGERSCVVCTDSCVEGPGLPEFCGDGALQPGDGEACDDGNDVETDDCTTLCRRAACGDGFVQEWNNETCDDGNADDTDGCTTACRPPRCGDGLLHDGEACDDGNEDDLDGCTSTCTTARCGDGFVQPGERCDDGNDDDGDDCSNACRWRFAGTTSLVPGVATLEVTSLIDGQPGSLRQVLATAPDGSVVSVPLTGVYLLTAGELVVSNRVSIVGPAAGTFTIDAGAGAVNRVLRVTATGDLFLSNVTITRGHASGSSGGGLLNLGSAVLAGVTITGNRTSQNPHSNMEGGGGIRNDGTLVFADGVISSNAADYRTPNGGGLYNTGTARIYRSMFLSNREGNSGGPGAIRNRGSLYVEDTTFRANRTDNENAGALWNVAPGTATFFQSVFDANYSRYGGGAVFNSSTTPVVLQRCTIANNSVRGDFSPPHPGGGTAGPVSLRSTVVSGNLHLAAADDVSGSGVVSSGLNVVGTSWSTVAWASDDVIGPSPLPAFTRNDGGPVHVLVPQRGSVVIDRGEVASLPTFDARGRPRQVGPGVDVGAVESAAPVVTVPVPDVVLADRAALRAVVTAFGRGTRVRWQLSGNAAFTSGVVSTPYVPAGNASAPVEVTWRRTGLTPGATYYLRAQAANADGTTTSEAVPFTTPSLP